MRPSSIAAAVLSASGLLFLAQGLGIVRWPSSSFMIGQGLWVWIGGAMAAAGLLVLLLARRR